jgi:hypothetical protein
MLTGPIVEIREAAYATAPYHGLLNSTVYESESGVVGYHVHQTSAHPAGVLQDAALFHTHAVQKVPPPSEVSFTVIPFGFRSGNKSLFTGRGPAGLPARLPRLATGTGTFGRGLLGDGAL